MEKNVEKAIDRFVVRNTIPSPPAPITLDGDKKVEPTESIKSFGTTENNEKSETTKKIVLDEREGLVERVDKIFVTRDGKQLLREQY